ncbi:hypothetical protein BsWGS_16137 [Bradybaena similaris]
MSSRRTRSGASLCSSEPRRLRRIPVRKQPGETSAGDTTIINSGVGASSNANSDPVSGRQVGKPNLPKIKPKQDSPKNMQPSCLNIWERLVKNDGEFMVTTAIKEDENKEQNCTDSKVKTLMLEQTASSDTGVVKKSRKPDILVSLLEGETAYNPVNQRKDTVCFKPDSISNPDDAQDNFKKLREKSVLSLEASGCNTERHSDTFHVSSSPVCFFHNCECHRNKSVADFSDMPDVPGEPFFVSLSKDENKELNMVKTSSGTVRVGCSLRKLSDHNRSYTETCTKPAITSTTERSRKIRMSADHKSGRRSGRFVCATDIRFHKTRLDETKDSGWSHQSKKISDNESKTTEQKNICDPEKNKQNVEKLYSKHSWNQDMCENEHANSENCHPSSEILQDKHKTSALTLLSEIRLKSNDFNVSSYSKSLTSCRSSHYPLMKEILTQQSYVPLPSATASTKYVVNPSELKIENADTESVKSIKTLKPSKSAVSITSVQGTDSDSENKGVIKRSERIRCKSGVEKPLGIALHKSVISTMKPLDRTFKDKAKLTNFKRSSKVTFNRDSQRKSAKKISEHVRKTAVVKDAQKGKPAMTREVMEAIIQSIEETVSGCSGAEKSEDILESVPTDMLVTSHNMDTTPHHNNTSIMTSSSMESLKVDHWSDCVNDHNYDISISSADTSYGLAKNPALITGNGTSNGGSDKALKMFSSKNAVRKAKRSSKTTNRSKSLKVRSVRSKVKSATARTVLVDTASCVSSSATDNAGTSDTDTTNTASAVYSASKRFRKKTRKAKEAFGNDDVFCDENWSEKKSKSKSRSNSTSSDSSNSSSQRRLRRSSQVGSNIADPVLEEHAFILWASENRSQLEQQHPSASPSEVDTFLLLRWCEVSDSLKAKFFLRAREAFSDDERNMIRSGSVTDLETSMYVDFFSDSKPLFTDFIRLPIERQRDMLRKWLKFFQKTLPKKEYIDFIITFKRACNRGSRNPLGGSKRTRMRCLDPSYYKMLFDMIRVTKPRVLEVFKVRQDKDKTAVADAYSIMLLKLVNNTPMTPPEPSSKSQALTEILEDLGIADNIDVYPSLDSCVGVGSSDKDRSDAVTKEETKSEIDTSLAFHEWRTVADIVNKVPLAVEIKAELRNDSGFDESDYSLLNCDLALGLLSGLSEISELPILDQETLDQVFLAPPRIATSFNQLKRTVNLYGRCLENQPQNPVTVASHSSMHAPPCLPRLLPTDQVSYPKINIQYSPSTSASVVHHLPIRNNNILPHKYTRRETCETPPVRGGWYRKNSPMDMHTYSTSIENMIQSPAQFNETHGKCFKVHAKVMSPQIKFNLQPMQLPMNSRSHQQNRLHPRIIPVSCSLQQRFPTIIYSPTNATLLDKLGSHHINQVGARPLSSSAATSSRISPQPIGLNTPSSLITSLSPLRSIKYSHNNKLYSPHCQMVPYRPRMQLMTGSSNGQRKATHTVPISTTSKAASSKAHGSLQQIKVCLSTQTLKIPIAKLREPRKNTHMKGKVKNFNMQHSSLEPHGSLPCTQACQFSVRATPSTSVLAKVLNFQTINEMEHLSKISLPDGLSTNTASHSRPLSSAFIGTMKPVTVQSISKGLKPTTQLQLMSVVSSPSMLPAMKTSEATQTAFLTDSHLVNRHTHMLEPMCNTYTVDSNSHLAKCSFVPPMYCVSLANVNANTTQHMNMATQNMERGEDLLMSEVCATSEGHYADALFDHGEETSDINGEFRIVGTRVVNTSNRMKGNSVNNNDLVTEALVRTTGSMYSLDSSENISSSLEHTETAKKAAPQDGTMYDIKTVFDSTTVAKAHTLEYSQERSRGALSPAKMATVSFVSQHWVPKQSLSHGSSTVDQFLEVPQTNPQAIAIDAGHCEDTGDGCVSENTPDLTAGQDSGGPLPAIPSNCGLTDSQNGPHELAAAETFLVTRDIPGQSSGFTCASGKDVLCRSMPVSCVTSSGDSDGYNVQSFISVAEDVQIEEEGATSGSTRSGNTTKVNADSCDSIGTTGYELQRSNLDSAKDTNDVAFTRSTSADCLPRVGVGQLCEHEYSIGVSSMSHGMHTCMKSAPESYPSGCASGASLQTLAKTDISSSLLLSSSGDALPTDQTMQKCDE